MKLEVGNSYKIILQINGVTLTYTCTVTSVDSIFVSFVDKFGKEYTYNKNLIMSFEEVKNG